MTAQIIDGKVYAAQLRSRMVRYLWSMVAPLMTAVGPTSGKDGRCSRYLRSLPPTSSGAFSLPAQKPGPASSVLGMQYCSSTDENSRCIVSRLKGPGAWK